MKIHKEGYKSLVLVITLLLLVNITLLVYLPVNQYFAVILLLFSLVICLFLLWFFRVPSRVPVIDDKKIISPADGRIVAIEETEETEYFKGRYLQVSIFMSPLDVHANVWPVTGTISYYRYHPGKFLVAWHPKSSIDNERNTIVIEKDNGTSILIRQIAGVVARRIVCHAREGDHAKQGDELGFIKFGSRVDLFLPAGVKLNVSIGQKVKSKTSVIASFM
jgi:phosphatidylserine decarboxylase